MVRHKALISCLKIFDIACMIACFAIAEVFVMPGQDVETVRGFMSLQISIGNFALFGGFLILWHLLFCAYGLYDDLLLASAYRKSKDVLKATSIGTCFIVAIAAVSEVSFINAQFMLIYWTTISLCSAAIRIAARRALIRFHQQEENRRRVLIVGVNTRSMRIAKQIEAEREQACRVIGFVDDTDMHAINFKSSGYQLVARYRDLADYLARTAVDEVLISLPIMSRSEDIAAAVVICEEQGVAYGVVRDQFKLDLKKSTIRQIDDQLLITVHPHAISGGQAAIKRVLDIFLSTVLIVLLLPVFVLVALLVKFTSAGPAIFKQERVGLNKKAISVLKFRTMAHGAEQQQAALEHLNDAAGPLFKIRNDPRVTMVGKFLRKSSLDELPQLFNVLKGDMSLVGPRPLALREYSKFDKDWYRRRVSIRPGMTGLWQINGRDQRCSFDDNVRLDLEYIDRWSLVLDTKIILKTIPAVLKGSEGV
jgi:exopolysaccharide biosynthesis polyprenyl glycosylphosphotransferase